MAAQPLLSIGMIVKNESRCLEKCLNALTPLRNAIPCELVIADTGSTDNTKEIAAKYADTLFDFPWVNDFSKARNAVMDRCKGKWFITIDADEYLESSPDELVALVTNESNLKYSCATFVKRNYSSVTLQGMYNDFSAVRIVKLTPQVRYSGAIHEKLNNVDLNKCISLPNTIFAHDGYATIDSNLSKQKAERNLKLLEIEYKKNPDDATVILQLLESTHISKNEKYKKSTLGMNFIKKLNKNSSDWKYIAPAIARKALQYAVMESFIETSEWFDWVFKNLSDSLFTLIDITYLYTQFCYQKEDYVSAEKYGNIYSDNIKRNKNRLNSSIESMISAMLFSHELSQNNIAIIVAKSALKNDNKNSCLEALESVDLSDALPATITEWLSIVSELGNDSAITILKNSVVPLLSEDSNFPDKDIFYNFLYNLFSCKSDKTENLKNFTLLPSDYGIFAKISITDKEKEIISLSKKISSYNKILPLAFCKLLSCNSELPDEFYKIPLEHLQKLFEDITENYEHFEELVLKYTCDEQLTDFNKLSFAFNMLSATISSGKEFSATFKNQLKESFYNISKLYLTNLYRDEILENDSVFATLPALHRFSIYFVIAIDSTDIKEKISLLRQALTEEPKMKELVNITLEKLQKEQKKLEAEKQLSASPELVELAKQIKVMLDNYPENSPELLAIKQSPVYKQVAHLIENL